MLGEFGRCGTGLGEVWGAVGVWESYFTCVQSLGRLKLLYFTCLEGFGRLNLSYFTCLEGSGRLNLSYFTCLGGSDFNGPKRT